MSSAPLQVSIVLDGEPASKGRPRLGKGRVYTPTATSSAEDLWRWTLRQSGISEPVADRAFAVRLRFYAGAWYRKDLDNMIKLVLDACTGLVWDDDEQVVGIDAWLYRGDPKPRTELVVTSVSQPTGPSIRCQTCGKSVPAKRNRKRDGTVDLRRFCSVECTWASKRVRRTCPKCGVVFDVPASSHQRFCSSQCSGGRGRRPASTITPEQFRRAVGLMAGGASQSAAARSIGVSVHILGRALAVTRRVSGRSGDARPAPTVGLGWGDDQKGRVRVRSRDEIDAELVALREQVAAAEAERGRLYAVRRQLFAEARALVPPMTVAALAASQGITETAVSLTLQSPDDRRAAKRRRAERAS